MIKTRFSKLITFFITVIISISLLTVLPVEEGNKAYAISTGQANIAARADYLYNIQWTCQKTVKGWNNEVTYTKGNTYRLPYGQPAGSKSYIYWNISIDNFIKATKDASSVFYTKRSSGGGSSVYYSIDCSAFASYCWGLSSRNTTSSWSSLLVTKVGACNSSNVSKIEVGDALNWAGHHVVIVSDVIYSNGKISKVEITEQTVPQTKRTTYSASKLASSFSSYTIYRYKNRDKVTPPPMPNQYVEIPQDHYYIKNASTGTYLNISGGKAANGQAAVLSTKQNANAFKFQAKGSKDAGYNLISWINNKYVLNAYSDTPSDGCKVTLYENLNNSTQKFKFVKSGSGYIIHNAYNENIVLTPSGSNVLLKTRTGAANQVWVLESSNTTTVTFHRNLNSEDTNTVSEKFTVGVANQKFGYNTDGTGRYGEMNAADVGFGRWTNPGYKLLGWSTKKNATARDWTTYSAVTDNWIKIYAPSVDLYAVWEKETLLGDLDDDEKVSVSDVVLLRKYLVKAEKLTETQWLIADMNSDGKVNVFDFIILKRIVLKNI